MKVVLISGPARHGKDQTGSYLFQVLTQNGKRALVLHYADFLKYFLRNYLGWDGNKDSSGRQLLQHWGTDIVRKNNPDTWVDMMINLIKGIKTEYDYIIIPDTRFPNEIEKMREEFETIAVRVERPNFDNGLPEEQKQHISETALDDYNFDVLLLNEKDLNFLYRVVEKILVPQI